MLTKFDLERWQETLDQDVNETWLNSLFGKQVTYTGKGDGGPTAWDAKVVGWGKITVELEGLRAVQFQLVGANGSVQALHSQRNVIVEGAPEPLKAEGLVKDECIKCGGEIARRINSDTTDPEFFCKECDWVVGT